jgi:hypothetical protein
MLKHFLTTGAVDADDACEGRSSGRGDISGDADIPVRLLLLVLLVPGSTGSTGAVPVQVLELGSLVQVSSKGSSTTGATVLLLVAWY